MSGMVRLVHYLVFNMFGPCYKEAIQGACLMLLCVLFLFLLIYILIKRNNWFGYCRIGQRVIRLNGEVMEMQNLVIQ